MKYEVIIERRTTEQIMYVVNGETEQHARRRALGGERGAVSLDEDESEGDWEHKDATKNRVVRISDAFDRARRAARYFGTEYEANLGNSTKVEYLDSVAMEYGFDDWESMPDGDLKVEASKLFNEGRKAERELVK